ncbi:hypothetical protein PENTCL1PPCAC_13115, partial [Pristionchus entomophagus]
FDFDPISAKVVSAAIANVFDPSIPLPASPLNSSEKRWMTRIVMMLRGAEAGELSVCERDEAVKEDLGEDSDVEWDYEETAQVTTCTRHLWTKDMMDDAYSFYRSGTRKRNNEGEGCMGLPSMRKKYVWIKSEEDIKALRHYGKTGVAPTNRNAQLQRLAEDLDVEVTEMIDAGTEFHDCNLQEIALAINEEKGYWPAFKASEGWIRNWKAKYRITSRHITKIVSVKTNRDKEKTLKLVEELREKVKKIVEEHPDIYVWNCDQTGMVKEAHGKRTNARIGSRTVEVVVQSKGATTSSITLLPIIGSDGYLKPKEFVQLGEPGGKLPQKGCFRYPNLEIAVGTSHIMGKETAKQFYKKVLFDGFVPPSSFSSSTRGRASSDTMRFELRPLPTASCS